MFGIDASHLLRLLVPAGQTPASRHLPFLDTNFNDYSQLISVERDGYHVQKNFHFWITAIHRNVISCGEPSRFP